MNFGFKSVLLALIVGLLVGLALGVNIGREKPLLSNPFEKSWVNQAKQLGGDALEQGSKALKQGAKTLKDSAGQALK